MMKIAVVTSQYPVPGDSSRGRPILQTIRALSALAHVAVFVPNARYPRWLRPRSYNYVEATGECTESQAVRVCHVSYATLPLLGRLTNGRAVAGAVLEPVRSFGPDVVLSYWLYPDAYGAAIVADRLGVPLVSGARGSDLRVRDRLSLALTRVALRRSAALVTVSEDLRNMAINQFGVESQRATVVPNGCDTKIFHPGDRSAARAALSLPRDMRLVLYVGRLVPAKGLRELLEAWRRLAADDPRLHLAFVGEGSMREELLEKGRAADVAGRVHVPGVADAARVAQWMRAANLFCLPSYSEGYPNVLIEALACGRPVVVTPVGGVVEIADASNSELAEPRAVEPLAAALRRALQRQWDEAALSRRFMRSWDDVASQTLAVCRSVIGQG